MIKKLRHTEDSGRLETIDSDYIYHYEVAQEINDQLYELYEQFKPPYFHQEIIKKITFDKKVSKKKMMKILIAEREMFESQSCVVNRLEELVKLREKFLKMVFELERKFTDPKYYEDVTPLVDQGSKLLLNLRKINKAIFEKYFLWKDYILYLTSIEASEPEPDTISHEHSGMGSLILEKFNRIGFESEIYFLYNDENYFEKIIDDTIGLSRSKWEQFFILEPLDVFMMKKGEEGSNRKRLAEYGTIEFNKQCEDM